MRADAWMPLYIADYLRKTMHLTRDQHGGYMLLLMACWDRGGRLPNDAGQLAGIAKASPAEWRKIGPVLMSFFDIEEDYIVQRRVLTEYDKAAKISESRRQSGLQGGRPRKQSESDEKPNGFANGKQTWSQTETPTRVAPPSPTTPPSEEGNADAFLVSLPSQDEPKERKRAYPPDFEEAWKAYPHHPGRSSKPNSHEEWKRLPISERVTLGAAIECFRPNVETVCGGKGAPCMSRWLKAGKHMNWTDGAPAASATPTAAAPKPDPWRSRVAEFVGPNIYWNRYDWGPAPGREGCQAPPEIQREFGVEPAKPQPVEQVA